MIFSKEQNNSIKQKRIIPSRKIDNTSNRICNDSFKICINSLRMIYFYTSHPISNVTKIIFRRYKQNLHLCKIRKQFTSQKSHWQLYVRLQEKYNIYKWYKVTWAVDIPFFHEFIQKSICITKEIPELVKRIR